MKTLSGCNDPKELLTWMNKNLTYHGVNKGKIWTPEEVLVHKKGHCWETAEFAYHEFTVLKLNPILLYIQTPDESVTHLTTIFMQNNQFYWYEWVWPANKGISGPYNDFQEIVNYIRTRFITEHKNIGQVLYGNSFIKKNMTELQYFTELQKNWTEFKINANIKNIYHQW